MKILHIITDSNIGGAGKLLLAFLDTFNRDEFDITIILPQKSRLISEISARNIKFIEAKHIAEKSFSFKSLCELYYLIFKIWPDIVHTHASFAGRVAARYLRRRVVYTRHYAVQNVENMGFFRKKLNFIFAQMFSDAIIATSQEAYDGLIKSGVAERIVAMIPNGVLPVRTMDEREKSEVRVRYGISSEAFVVSQIARLSTEKGHVFTLDTAKILMEDSEIIFLLAGDGPLEEDLRLQISEKGIKNVIMAGFVSDVDEIINISNLQINSSFTETTCLALLEGMSAGIPAVATNVGGNPQVISHEGNGLLVPVKNAQAMAKAIKKFKSNKDLYDNCAQNARKIFKAEFDSKIMTQKIQEIYIHLKGWKHL